MNTIIQDKQCGDVEPEGLVTDGTVGAGRIEGEFTVGGPNNAKQIRSSSIF